MARLQAMVAFGGAQHRAHGLVLFGPDHPRIRDRHLESPGVAFAVRNVSEAQRRLGFVDILGASFAGLCGRAQHWKCQQSNVGASCVGARLARDENAAVS
ncbi:hypothetical protein EMIT043CA1_20185 [Pseudomonas brassicacearum]